jgi:hypothetical protein
MTKMINDFASLKLNKQANCLMEIKEVCAELHFSFCKLGSM